jgi:hypothetical protein
VSSRVGWLRPSAHPLSLSFVCPEVRKHTAVLNYQAQSAAGIFAAGAQISPTKAAPLLPEEGINK